MPFMPFLFFHFRTEQNETDIRRLSVISIIGYVLITTTSNRRLRYIIYDQYKSTNLYYCLQCLNLEKDFIIPSEKIFQTEL